MEPLKFWGRAAGVAAEAKELGVESLRRRKKNNAPGSG